MTKLHPDAQRVVDLIVEAKRPSYPSVGHMVAREYYMKARQILSADPPDVGHVADLICPGPAGDIPLRHYRGKGVASDMPAPVLVYFHGGGWVIGNLESHDVVCRTLANEAKCAVISVDYRLAPEHKYPAAVDDSIAATRWIAANAEKLAIDPARIAVGGDSAGGNLSAIVSLDARDNAGPGICFQLLIYPATDMHCRHASHDIFAEQLPLTKETMLWFVDLYLNTPHEKDDWRASPIAAKNHTKLPPAYVLTAGCDPLRDEGEAYAKALEASGVPVTLKRWDGQVHGFITMSKFITDAHTAKSEMAAALRGAFANA